MPQPPVIVIISGDTPISFDSVSAAAEYLFSRARHGWMEPVDVRASSTHAYNRLRKLLRENISTIWWANRTVADRHMAEASSWEDYFSEKDQRNDLSERYDTELKWLRCVGRIKPRA